MNNKFNERVLKETEYILNTNNNDVVSLSLVIDFICEFFIFMLQKHHNSYITKQNTK